VKSSFPVNRRLPFLNSARVAYRPRAQKKRPGACFSKAQYVSLAIVNAKPPNDQATLQNCGCPGAKTTVDSDFDGLARLLEVCVSFVKEFNFADYFEIKKQWK